ncbi:sterile alpha motif domain-containing protein 3-like [Carassius auratus]|uniref:Sterile alpha motif domain-containing protein 3-like n=1 Tax=Carassius auratus TaxID=7957 RepID=A0A6P6K866_CARAU|nr:sterile alpha motif domain-containing protein 3-like [Carassius auratus]
MLFRIVLAADDIRKLVIDELPESVEDLKSILVSKLNLDGEFVLQYEDPDFQNDLVNLTSLTDLPKERATLKIVQKSLPNEQFNGSSNQDTASLTSASSPLGSGTPTQTKSWPDPFIIPSFSYDAELKLRRANDAHEKDGSLLDVTKELKTEILNKLAEVIFNLNPYPTREQIESVSEALVKKHPCLKEPGSSCGWYCWKYSLSFKMGNFRQKLRVAGCPTVSLSTNGAGKKQLKKPRRSETNFLPDMPDGETSSSLEEERKALLIEVTKKNPNNKFIDAAMARTYALRRKEIIEQEPLVSDIQTRWPALFTERQIVAEFSRLLSADLMRSFYGGLDELLPRFLELYKNMDQDSALLNKILQWLGADDSNQNKRTAVLLGLPHCLRENSTSFLKTCEPTSEIEDVTKGNKVGILIVTEQQQCDVLPTEIIDITLVLEEHLVVTDISSVPNAFALLMGLFYVVNIEYPKHMKYTFEALQKLVMNIGGSSCSSRVHGLRNKLFRKK